MTENAVETRQERLEIIDAEFAGPHGPVPIRVYRVPGSDTRNGLLWIHGGAFMFGDLDMPESHWVAQQLATEERVVVTADYRLAPVPDSLAPYVEPRPGFHFPVASEELTALFDSLVTTELVAPTTDWVIGGASAGGNLSAGAALRLRDQEGAQPRGLQLVYPLLHAELPPFRPELAEKVSKLPDAQRSDASSVAGLNLHYVGQADLLANPYAFPGGHDLEGLPSTFILNSDNDGLRASGEAFASELAAAGVDVKVIREPGSSHGHINGPDNIGAAQSIGRIEAWLEEIEDTPTREVPHAPDTRGM
jgi:acetyl esterase/lipase